MKQELSAKHLYKQHYSYLREQLHYYSSMGRANCFEHALGQLVIEHNDLFLHLIRAGKFQAANAISNAGWTLFSRYINLKPDLNSSTHRHEFFNH